MATANGKAVVEAVAERAAGESPVVPAGAVVSTFARLVRLADSCKGGTARTAVTRRTPDGTVTMTVTGKLCLNVAEAVVQGNLNGGKFSARPATGFDVGEAPSSRDIAREDAGRLVAEICDGSR